MGFSCMADRRSSKAHPLDLKSLSSNLTGLFRETQEGDGAGPMFASLSFVALIESRNSRAYTIYDRILMDIAPKQQMPKNNSDETHRKRIERAQGMCNPSVRTGSAYNKLVPKQQLVKQAVRNS